jgi:hydrogenase 3 maturation protease
MLEELEKRLKGIIIIACVGNELKGDDGAGPALAKALKGKIRAQVVNCEEVPESYTGKIKELKPDTIVIVDAVDLKAAPGSIAIIEKERLDAITPYSTHNVPLKIFVQYLEAETKADIFLIGIQPSHLVFSSGLSEEVEKAVASLAAIFQKLLGKE